MGARDAGRGGKRVSPVRKKDRRPEGIIIVLLKLIVWFMVRVEVFFMAFVTLIHMFNQKFY
jgi:hypothetical protein